MLPYSGLLRLRATALAALLLLPVAVWGQTCSPNATPTLIHPEGLAEKTGDVVITCTGGTAGTQRAASLFAAYSNNITNRLAAGGAPIGITVVVVGGGASAGVDPIALNSPTLLASGFRYTIPVVPATPVTITISGVRSGVGLTGGPQNITAALTVTGVPFSAIGVPIAVANSAPPSLAATVVNYGLPCGGSPLPATLDYAGFSAGSLSSAVRITETSFSALAVKQAGEDQGVRLILKLSGYGTGIRIFVPDVIVGNNGTSATGAAVFANNGTGGTYTPASKQLLLSRVAGAAASGEGGNTVQSLPGSVTSFSSMGELAVTAGIAYAVYEVIDTDPATREVAYIPVFFAYAQNNCSTAAQTALSITMGPVSTVGTGTANDPIPRYAAVTPGSDCQLLTDCAASYNPRLLVDPLLAGVTGSSLGPVQIFPLRIGNGGGAQMVFSATVSYPDGQPSGWLTASPTSGINNVTVLLYADPVVLQPGTYLANVTINAGSAGQAVIPVTFTVGAVGVTVQALVNAASYQTVVVPGSYAALFGLNLAGTNVGVTFNGLPAAIVFKNNSQINLIVPRTLAASLGAVNVVTTVDGKQSNTFRAALAPNALGLFAPFSIVNADGTINSSSQPAPLGSTVAVYLTGLSSPPTGQVTVNIGGFTGLIPLFAGDQGLPGLAQVNIQVPQAQTAATFPLTVCIPGLGGQPGCSNTVSLYTK